MKRLVQKPIQCCLLQITHKFKDVAGTVNLSMDNAGNLSATADVIAFASSDKD